MPDFSIYLDLSWDSWHSDNSTKNTHTHTHTHTHTKTVYKNNEPYTVHEYSLCINCLQ